MNKIGPKEAENCNRTLTREEIEKVIQEALDANVLLVNAFKLSRNRKL